MRLGKLGFFFFFFFFLIDQKIRLLVLQAPTIGIQDAIQFTRHATNNSLMRDCNTCLSHIKRPDGLVVSFHIIAPP